MDVEKIHALPGLWSQPWMNIRRQDFLGDPEKTIFESVIEKAGPGYAKPERIFLLTQLGSAALTFNPVSFYYAFDKQGSLIYILSEITNTPWNERHTYLVQKPEEAFEFQKDFHVSPFLGMQYIYRWRFSAPDEHLSIHMENLDAESRKLAFDATLILKRTSWNIFSFFWSLIKSPLPSWRSLFFIYLHALFLLLKGTTFYPHPKKGASL